MAVPVLHVCDKFGVRGSSIHGVSRLFSSAANFGRLAARATGARLVLHEHFADPRMPGYQALADRVLRGLTDGAIAVSGSTRDFLVRERSVPAERVRVIWNGAPLDEFAPVAQERALELRQALGIPAQALVFGTIGRLSTQKGHVHLLDAAARVLPQRPEARLLVVGDGDLAAPLREQATALGIAGQTLFAGHRTDVRELLGVLDVFCISSLYEGTPLALFEAMAAGKAIVSTSVDGCREVLTEGETGLLVPPADAPALAGALERVLADAALRSRLAARAREASRRYDVAACVEAMQAFYDDLLGKA
jgi:glycosyltransferase involved in cell wall biosynthesis